MMNGDCECGECESCIAALKHIEQRNKELFGELKIDEEVIYDLGDQMGNNLKGRIVEIDGGKKVIMTHMESRIDGVSNYCELKHAQNIRVI